MKRIRIPNLNLFNNVEKTYLDTDYSSGTTLTVISNLGFAENDIAVIGAIGEELTEAQKVSSISGDTSVVIASAYKFDHNKGTIIQDSPYDQIIIERNTGSGFSVIATISIQWDKPETLYIDTTGSDAYEYRFKFYNQYSTNASPYSPTLQGSGFTRDSVGRMVLNVRKRIKDANKNRIKDTEIIRQLQDAKTIIEAVRPDWWFAKVDTFKALNGFNTSANQPRYELDDYDDMNYVERIRFKYNDGTDVRVYDLDPLDEMEFDPFVVDQNRPTDDNVQRFKFVPADEYSDQGYIEVDPVPKTSNYGTFYPIYYKKLTDLNSVDDRTEIPLPQVLEDYAVWKIEEQLGNDARAKIAQDLFYGPSPQDKDRRALTGIALLEQMNKSKGKVAGLPSSLVKFRGQRGARRAYTDRFVNRDYIAENYVD